MAETTASAEPKPIPWGKVFFVATPLVLCGFLLYALAEYQYRFSVQVFFLGLGAFSLLTVAYLLLRAAQSFEEEEEEHAFTDLKDEELDDLMSQKRSLLKAIKEVEFDQEMGKVDQADADAAINIYRGRAVEVLKAIDAHRREGRYDEVVEKELQKRLDRASDGEGKGAAETEDDKKGASSDESAAAEAAPSDDSKDATASDNRCSACDTVNDDDARFCKSCGASFTDSSEGSPDEGAA